MSCEKLVGAGTTGFVGLYPGQTVVKFPHGDAEDIALFQHEANVYERFETVRGQPKSLLEYRGKTSNGILLEYAEQGWLRGYLRGENPSPSSTLLFRWAEQAAEALAYCHANGVLHGDLNCSNLFLAQSLDLKLGDFATAAMDEPTPTLYSSAYRLPNAETTSIQTEIFAFGSTLFEMATGSAPFEHLTDSEIEGRYRQRRYPQPPHGAALEEIILKCWRLEFDTMDEVLDAIRAECTDPTHIRATHEDSDPLSPSEKCSNMGKHQPPREKPSNMDQPSQIGRHLLLFRGSHRLCHSEGVYIKSMNRA